jgi:pilus assembly protein Flp/PilA
VTKLISKFRRDEKGAAFLEYTVLLGILLAVAIGSIVTAGTWASGKWSTLVATLPT